MTKQEQIEEMAEAVVCSAIVSNAKIDNEVAINLRGFVDNMYRIGYRKIDDNCAVITKDELKQYKAQAVKEFAESIIKELWDIGIDSNGKQFKCGDLTSKDVWRIAKQFGVEVEE